jgi:hypothetical protein
VESRTFIDSGKVGAFAVQNIGAYGKKRKIISAGERG